MRYFSWMAVLAILATTSGCMSTGIFTAGNVTEVNLNEENYRIVATGVTGEAEAGYILGVSGGVGMTMQTFALARVEGEGMLYQAALGDLWSNFARDHGAVEGRSLALVNVRFDSEALNLIIYTKPRVAVIADVVEFEAVP